MNAGLYKIIDLLLNEKGFKIVSGFEQYKDIKAIDKHEIDLDNLSLKLLKILEVLKDKIGENKLTFNMETINSQFWLEQHLYEIKKLKLTNSCATKDDIELLISYKLATILDYAKDSPREEIEKITN